MIKLRRLGLPNWIVDNSDSKLSWIWTSISVGFEIWRWNRIGSISFQLKSIYFQLNSTKFRLKDRKSWFKDQNKSIERSKLLIKIEKVDINWLCRLNSITFNIFSISFDRIFKIYNGFLSCWNQFHPAIWIRTTNSDPKSWLKDNLYPIPNKI